MQQLQSLGAAVKMALRACDDCLERRKRMESSSLIHLSRRQFPVIDVESLIISRPSRHDDDMSTARNRVTNRLDDAARPQAVSAFRRQVIGKLGTVSQSVSRRKFTMIFARRKSRTGSSRNVVVFMFA